jgi:LmbE family N-acetylglucosaminyl deacetylase
MNNSILVVAAHPDDEILGCGGTIAKHVSQGDKVHVVIMAEGITSRDRIRNREAKQKELSELAACAREANQLLGVTSLKMLDYPDNRMDSLDRLDIIKQVEELINDYKPDIVYTHHVGDVNIDHQRIHEAVITACRPIPSNHRVNRLYFFETVSSTEWMTANSAPPFTPQLYVNITQELDLKIKALKAYFPEMRRWPHARSIEAIQHLARWRGANIGVEAAEAFMIGRIIQM